MYLFPIPSVEIHMPTKGGLYFNWYPAGLELYYSNHCPLGTWLWFQRCKFPLKLGNLYLEYSNKQWHGLPEDFVDSKSTLIQVMYWCRHLSYHYLISCWQSPEPRSMCQLAGQSLAMVINDTGELWCGIFTEAQMTSSGWYLSRNLS